MTTPIVSNPERDRTLCNQIIDHLLDDGKPGFKPVEVIGWIENTFEGSDRIMAIYLFGFMLPNMAEFMTARLLERGVATLPKLNALAQSLMKSYAEHIAAQHAGATYA
jgi:hypothetical protein